MEEYLANIDRLMTHDTLTLSQLIEVMQLNHSQIRHYANHAAQQLLIGMSRVLGAQVLEHAIMARRL